MRVILCLLITVDHFIEMQTQLTDETSLLPPPRPSIKILFKCFAEKLQCNHLSNRELIMASYQDYDLFYSCEKFIWLRYKVMFAYTHFKHDHVEL